jgi:WD40 repeat protein
MLVEIDTPIPVSQLAWSPRGNQLVFDGARDIQVWSAVTGQWLRTLNAIMNSDAELAFSPSDNLIAFVNMDNNISIIEIWNTGTGLRTQQLHRHTDRVIDLNWNAAGLLSTAADDTIRFWDVQTGQEVQTIQTGRYPRVELNAAGTILLVRDETYGIHTRDAVTGEILAQFDSSSGVTRRALDGAGE